MINAIMISLNDGKPLLFKSLININFDSFKASGKIESMDINDEYFLHFFRDGNEKIYAHTKNYKNFVVGVLADDRESLTNIIDKIWLKFEKYLINIDMIKIETKNFNPSLFQAFVDELDIVIKEII